VVSFWTLCRGQAAEREENRNSPGTARKTGVRKKQKKYERSQYVIENKDRHVGNELKRTQNEPQLSAQMREMEPKFELIDGAHSRAGGWIAGDVAGTGIALLAETRGTAREYKNSGNKARMLMKKKDITF
jgi:hypothetical protein